MGAVRPRVLAITGCTAIGKSRMALTLAKRLGGAIISADSVQSYRGLDIGSAKLRVEERLGVQHYLVDVKDPREADKRPFSAFEFRSQARTLIRELTDKGIVPIVVGGTGFYLQYLLLGDDQFDAIDPRDSIARDQAIDLWTQIRSGTVLDEVVNAIIANFSTKKPVSSAYFEELFRNVDPRNNRRVITAIQTAIRAVRHPNQVDDPSRIQLCRHPTFSVEELSELDMDVRSVFVMPSCRTWLYRSIDLRCEEMVQQGLLDETAQLLYCGLLRRDSSPARAIGYRQAIDYLDECFPLVPRFPFQVDREAMRGGTFDVAAFRVFLNYFQNASRKLARKQLVWFRRMDLVRWMQLQVPTISGQLFTPSDLQVNPSSYDLLIDQICDYYTMSSEQAVQTLLGEAETQVKLREPESPSNVRIDYRSVPLIFKEGIHPETLLNLSSKQPIMSLDHIRF